MPALGVVAGYSGRPGFDGVLAVPGQEFAEP